MERPIIRNRRLRKNGNSYFIAVPHYFISESKEIDLDKEYDVVFIERSPSEETKDNININKEVPSSDKNNGSDIYPGSYDFFLLENKNLVSQTDCT